MNPSTIDQLKDKLKEAWLRGKAQRIEIGTLLLELRAQAEHGDWGSLLAEVGIPASTARDYMTEASREIHGFRVFENGRLTFKDAEAEEMQEAVNVATAEVADAPPELRPAPAPGLDFHARVKGPVLYCTADQKDAYEAAKRESKDRVYEIFHNALLEVIGEQEEVRDEAVAA